MPFPMPVPADRSTALVAHPQFLPPVRRRPQRQQELFEGDAAIIELRYRLTEARPGTLPALYTELPPRPAASRGSSLRAVLGYAGAVLIAATTAGTTGYVAGHVKFARPHPAATQSSSVQPMRPLPPPPTQSAAPKRNLEPAPRGDGIVAEAVPPRHPADLPPTQSAAPKRNLEPAPRSGGIVVEAAPPRHPADLPLPQYLADSAPRLRLGAALLAAGDVAAARTMFEHIAEAGNADGAFALAETYDPAVLRQVPLRGSGITADTAQARHWYEKARDMGSSTAPERIVRLRMASNRK